MWFVGNCLSELAKRADDCQTAGLGERGTAPLQERWGREVAIIPLHPAWCWEKGWQRGSVKWTCWDSHRREVDASIGIGKSHPVYPQRAPDSLSWWLKPTRNQIPDLGISFSNKVNWTTQRMLDYLISLMWKIAGYMHTYTPKPKAFQKRFILVLAYSYTQ